LLLYGVNYGKQLVLIRVASALNRLARKGSFAANALAYCIHYGRKMFYDVGAVRRLDEDIPREEEGDKKDLKFFPLKIFEQKNVDE